MHNILLFIFLACVILVTSLLISSLLKIRSAVALALCTFLFSVSNIIITVTISGLFYQLNNQLFISILHVGIFMITFVLWIKSKKPRLPNPRDFIIGIAQFIKDTFKAPEITTLLVVLFFSMIFQFILISIMPPNSHDSLTTHLSRVGYWYQNGTYFPFNIHNLRDIYYPVNPAFQALWTVIVSGTDKWVEISQFIAMQVCSVAIYGISRLLKRSTQSSLFNALIFLSYPIVIMQGTTSQTDLIVAAFISCAFYFLILGLKQKQIKYIPISCLGMALALGSKQTAFFILPGYFILFLLLWTKNRNEMPGYIQTFLRYFFLFFLFFGSLTYVINLIHFNGFFGPPGTVTSESGFTSIFQALEKLKLNSLRLFYNSIDPSGLPSPIKNYFIKAKSTFFSGIFNAFHINLESSAYSFSGHKFNYLTVPHLSEDESWYGPVGFILMAIAIIYGLIQGIKKKDHVKLGLVITFLIYSICIVVSRSGWDAYQGRYFLSVAVLTTPLIDMNNTKHKFLHLTRFGTIILAILIIFTTQLLNEGKPVAILENNPSLIRETIWNMDRIDKITIQDRNMRNPIKSISKFLPADANVGLCIETGMWDYPFFREDFSQKLIPISPKENLLDESWLKQNNIEYVIMNTYKELWETKPIYLELLYEYNNWKLYSVQ